MTTDDHVTTLDVRRALKAYFKANDDIRDAGEAIMGDPGLIAAMYRDAGKRKRDAEVILRRYVRQPVLAQLRRELNVETLRGLADRWELAANAVTERALIGDPSAAMAAGASLRSCAAALRGALVENAS